MAREPTGAVAVDAIDLHGVPRLAVQLAVAVVVLLEMAIHALHAALEMDVLQVHRLPEFLRVVVRHDLVVRVEQRALAIALVDRAEDPAVAVEIGKLRVLELRVELRRADGLQKLDVRPQATLRGGLGIAHAHGLPLCLARIALLGRIHELAVGLVLPPRVPVIRRHHVRARMHVARHALAGRNRPREDVLQRMAGFASSEIVGSLVVDLPSLPSDAYCAECTGERSLA